MKGLCEKARVTNPDSISLHHISAIKQFRRVTLVVNMSFSNEQEFEEIKQELSGLKID